MEGYKSPHEKLNEALSGKDMDAPDFRGVVAKEIFVRIMAKEYEKPDQIHKGTIQQVAAVSVDAADLLIHRLAATRKY